VNPLTANSAKKGMQKNCASVIY